MPSCFISSFQIRCTQPDFAVVPKVILRQHQLFCFRCKRALRLSSPHNTPRHSPRHDGAVTSDESIPAIISACIVHRAASLLPSSHGRMLPEADRIADRTGFRAPVRVSSFQLFGDVMPETLFAVRSDSETYGMQRSVERQVNTSYPVFPHIRYIFIAARLPLTGQECRSLRSVSRLFGYGARSGRETCCFASGNDSLYSVRNLPF